MQTFATQKELAHTQKPHLKRSRRSWWGGFVFYNVTGLAMSCPDSTKHYSRCTNQSGSQQQQRAGLRNDVDRSGKVKAHVNWKILQHVESHYMVTRRQKGKYCWSKRTIRGDSVHGFAVRQLVLTDMVRTRCLHEQRVSRHAVQVHSHRIIGQDTEAKPYSLSRQVERRLEDIVIRRP